MSDLSCYVTTFNCGRAPLDVDFFAASLFRGLTAASNVPPDLLVLALQEIAPVGYSFIGGALLAPYFSRFHTAIQAATRQRFIATDEDYGVVAVENVGLTAIMVLARPDVQARVRGLKTAGVGFGHWETGNKGAVGVRFGIQMDDEDDIAPLTFVAAHLAPMEDRCEKRNQDWRSVCEGLVFESHGTVTNRPGEEDDQEPLLPGNDETSDGTGQQSLFYPPSHIFFAGDLNYRTSDSSPKPTEYKSWPASAEDAAPFSKLFERDQLTRERLANRTLHHLTEAKINFPPTYKYSNEAQLHAANLAELNADRGNQAEGKDVRIWAKHRTPSWCDRILYPVSATPKVHSYTALPVQPTSDHRPVILSCTLPLQASSDLETLKPPFAVRKDWKEKRVAARRLEVTIGVAAYLTMTWEGEALLVGTVVGLIGGYLVLRGMIGG